MEINHIEKEKETKVRIIKTSKNNPELAEKIKQASARIMKQNYQLYKDLENK